MNIIKTLKKHPDGCSVKQNGLNYTPSYGYFVALTDYSFNTITAESLNKIKKEAEAIGVKNWYFGYWLDKKTGLHYLDVAIHLKSKTEAIATAKKYNQKAIFDCKKIDSIYL